MPKKQFELRGLSPHISYIHIHKSSTLQSTWFIYHKKPVTCMTDPFVKIITRLNGKEYTVIDLSTNLITFRAPTLSQAILWAEKFSQQNYHKRMQEFA